MVEVEVEVVVAEMDKETKTGDLILASTLTYGHFLETVTLVLIPILKANQ